MATTGANGRFVLRGLDTAAGPPVLVVDGPDDPHRRDLGAVSAPLAALLGHAAVAGAVNAIAAPLVLPRLDVAHAIQVGRAAATTPLVVTSPLLPGVSLRIAAGSAITGNGRAVAGPLELTRVPTRRRTWWASAGSASGSRRRRSSRCRTRRGTRPGRWWG
jgi:hypothetical protein